jgi:hypothetical protein
VPAGHTGAAVLTRVVPTVCVAVLALAPGASGSAEDDAVGGNAVDTDAVVADAVVVADPRLSESSALAVSPRDPDLLYTVNDSGHAPVVFVVDRSGGADSQVVGTTSLAGLDSPDLDPEAIAVAGDVLWVADIGDNGADRTDIALYALPAPGRGTATVRPEHYPLAYPEGLRDDAEALVADPASARMWVVTKGWLSGSVFEVPDPLVPDRVNRLRPLRGVEVPLLVTDGTALPGYDAAVLRTYVGAHVYTLPGWERAGSFGLPRQEQGEALTALPGDAGLLAGSEGTPTRIDRVRPPTALLTELKQRQQDIESRSTPGSGSTDDDDADRPGSGRPGADESGAAPSVALLAAGTVVMAGSAAAGLALVVRRRRR